MRGLIPPSPGRNRVNFRNFGVIGFSDMKQKIIHKDGSLSFCELMMTDWQLLKTKLLLATLLSDYHTDIDFSATRSGIQTFPQ